MLTHIKKYWIAYLVLVVVLVAIIFYNWGMIKGWFMSENLFDGTPRYDDNGNLITGQSSGKAMRCPIGCLIPTGTKGLYTCASPCNLTE